MTQPPIQDFYPENIAVCYGCGRLNDHGLHIQTFWDGETAVCTFRPQPYHKGFPGFVYGGLIASLIDCHACGAAAAAAYTYAGRDPNTEPPFRFVTGNLNVRYLRPTPMDTDLELRATVREVKGRKTIVDVTLFARGEICATGEVVAFEMPDEMIPK